MATLNKPVVVTPAIEAVTTTTFQVIDVRENYGVEEGTVAANGPTNSVRATIKFATTPPHFEDIMVWKDDEYLAVRGTWTDETLTARIVEILENR